MPNTREKLIEKINTKLMALPYGEITLHTAEEITDSLIEDGYITGTNAGKWISVKDRLPEAGTKALCYLKRGEYWTAVWDDCGDNLWSDGEAWCSNGEVTHWMLLPQPPKGE